MQILFRQEQCIRLVLQRSTGTCTVLEIELSANTLTVYIRYSVKAILQPIFDGSQKLANYVKGMLTTDECFKSRTDSQSCWSIQMKSRTVSCSLKPCKKRIAIKLKTREP